MGAHICRQREEERNADRMAPYLEGTAGLRVHRRRYRPAHLRAARLGAYRAGGGRAAARIAVRTARHTALENVVVRGAGARARRHGGMCRRRHRPRGAFAGAGRRHHDRAQRAARDCSAGANRRTKAAADDRRSGCRLHRQPQLHEISPR